MSHLERQTLHRPLAPTMELLQVAFAARAAHTKNDGLFDCHRNLGDIKVNELIFATTCYELHHIQYDMLRATWYLKPHATN